MTASSSALLNGLIVASFAALLASVALMLRKAYQLNNHVVRREIESDKDLESLRRHDAANAAQLQLFSQQMAANQTRLTDLYERLAASVSAIDERTRLMLDPPSAPRVARTRSTDY